MTERLRGIAEMQIVHRAADKTVKSVEIVKTPVTYQIGPDGNPTDIRKV